MSLIESANTGWKYWGDGEKVGSIFSCQSRRSFTVVGLAIFEANYGTDAKAKKINTTSLDISHLEAGLRFYAKSIIDVSFSFFYFFCFSRTRSVK